MVREKFSISSVPAVFLKVLVQVLCSSSANSQQFMAVAALLTTSVLQMLKILVRFDNRSATMSQRVSTMEDDCTGSMVNVSIPSDSH